MKTLGEIRKEYILQVLRRTNWDLKAASRKLKVTENYLKKEIQKIKHPAASTLPEKSNLQLKESFKK